MELLKSDTCAISIWVTWLCNLNCSYCYEKAYRNDDNMTIEYAVKVIIFIENHLKQMHANECYIQFHGGEPLLNIEVIKYIVDALRRNVEVKYMFSLTTNGTLINNDIIDYFSTVFSEISVSIDGDRFTHSQNRVFLDGESSFDIVIQNSINIANRMPIRVRMTITPDSVSLLSKNVIFLLSAGFDSIVPILDYYCDGWDNTSMMRFRTELDIIRKYMIENNIDLNKVAYISKRLMFRKLIKCNGGFQNLAINTNGDIYPCSFIVGDRDEIIGNASDGIDWECVSRYQCILEAFIEECKGCKLYDGCISKRCKFVNKRITGNYLLPSPIMCEMQKLQM